jgi:hypothetical protein
MKSRILLALLCLLVLNTYGQDSLKKTNPIIYLDYGIGFGETGVSGIQFNAGLNYQYKKSLFTVRVINITDLKTSVVVLTPFFALPEIKFNGSLSEYAALYGLRFINGGHSFSFSVGLSMNDRVALSPSGQHIESTYVGVPFETNVLWFKAKKERYRIYGIVPVGKPTSLGGSVGFKLAGNVSQHSYMSLALVFGPGYHKQY